MNAQIFHTQLTVETVLKQWPETFSVFRSQKTNCIGCLLQRFCTLEDVAETYHLAPPELVMELEKCVQEIDRSQRSAL